MLNRWWLWFEDKSASGSPASDGQPLAGSGRDPGTGCAAILINPISHFSGPSSIPSTSRPRPGYHTTTNDDDDDDDDLFNDNGNDTRLLVPALLSVSGVPSQDEIPFVTLNTLIISHFTPTPRTVAFPDKERPERTSEVS